MAIQEVVFEGKEYQGWHEFFNKFRPITNKLNGEKDNYTFETYGTDLDFIKLADPKHVWTWVQGDMCDVILAGYHFVNRIGYHVTEVPWDNEWDSVLLSAEVECECYSEDEDVMDARDLEYGDPNCKQCEGSGYVTNYV